KERRKVRKKSPIRAVIQVTEHDQLSGRGPSEFLPQPRSPRIVEDLPMTITLRNVITNERLDIEPTNGKTVRQAIRDSGFVLSDLGVTNKDGANVSERPIRDFEGEVLNIGLPNERVRGGV